MPGNRRIRRGATLACVLLLANNTFAADDAAWAEYFQQAETKRPDEIQQRLESIKTAQAQLRLAKGDDKLRLTQELKTLRQELAGLKSGILLPRIVVGLKFAQGSIGVLNGPGIDVEIVKVIDGNRALGKVYGNDFMLEAETKDLSDGKRLDLSRDVVEVNGKTTFAPVLGPDAMIPVVKVIPKAELDKRRKEFLRQRKTTK